MSSNDKGTRASVVGGLAKRATTKAGQRQELSSALSSRDASRVTGDRVIRPHACQSWDGLAKRAVVKIRNGHGNMERRLIVQPKSILSLVQLGFGHGSPEEHVLLTQWIGSSCGCEVAQFRSSRERSTSQFSPDHQPVVSRCQLELQYLWA